MSDPADSSGSARAALRMALLDYSRSPGKFQVGLRQPQILFAALRDVLQIAVGREADGSDRGQETAALRDSARFFVRTALLYPSADHYALLGLERKAENADLKDRYRLLMRLLHPDFSGPAAGTWPADSAVRVNRAYDILSSAVERRLYDETLPQLQGARTAGYAESKRPRPAMIRPDADVRQSHFKTLAIVCAVAGAALVIVIVSATGSPESAHLVQRAPVQPDPVVGATNEPDEAPAASPVARLQEALAQFRPAQAVTPTKQPEPQAARSARAGPEQKPIEPLRSAAPHPSALPAPPALRQAEPAEQVSLERVTQSPRAALFNAAPPPHELKPEVVLAATSVAEPAAPQPAPAALIPAPVQVALTPRPAFRPGPTLIEAQPLLSQLLQVMEGGRGDRILNLLDADARSKPSAQALSRQYDIVVDGARPVRVSHVEFKAEPADGRLLVVGHFRVLAGEHAIGALGRKMVLRAEFASREGNVVITGLSGGPVN